jgi:hypothetical protein
MIESNLNYENPYCNISLVYPAGAVLACCVSIDLFSSNNLVAFAAISHYWIYP